MPDDPANLWNRWAVHLLPCITIQCGILAFPFHTSTPGWEQLPVTLAMLIKGDHQTIRHQLHKAEEHSIAGFELISQQCQSYRWSAEILPATDEQSILIHAYWGMGLHAQHPAVYGLCIRFQDSCAESKELIQRVLELTRLESLLLDARSLAWGFWFRAPDLTSCSWSRCCSCCSSVASPSFALSLLFIPSLSSSIRSLSYVASH